MRHLLAISRNSLSVSSHQGGVRARLGCTYTASPRQICTSVPTQLHPPLDRPKQFLDSLALACPSASVRVLSDNRVERSKLSGRRIWVAAGALFEGVARGCQGTRRASSTAATATLVCWRGLDVVE